MASLMVILACFYSRHTRTLADPVHFMVKPSDSRYSIYVGSIFMYIFCRIPTLFHEPVLPGTITELDLARSASVSGFGTRWR